MVIGLLNAFTREEEEQTGTAEIDAFRDLLSQSLPGWNLCEFRLTEGELPADAAECDAWLITGSPQGVYDDHPWIDRLSSFIRSAFAAGRPQVGICFGHQILAHALGGRAEKSSQGWGIGLHRFDLGESPEWLTPIVDQPALYFCHQDQVVRLPPGATWLGGDARCPNAMFAIDRRVLGIQGHPEFTPGFMTGLVEVMRPQVGPAAADRAVDSLADGVPDSDTFARWIANFLSD